MDIAATSMGTIPAVWDASRSARSPAPGTPSRSPPRAGWCDDVGAVVDRDQLRVRRRRSITASGSTYPRPDRHVLYRDAAVPRHVVQRPNHRVVLERRSNRVVALRQDPWIARFRASVAL